MGLAIRSHALKLGKPLWRRLPSAFLRIIGTCVAVQLLLDGLRVPKTSFGGLLFQLAFLVSKLSCRGHLLHYLGQLNRIFNNDDCAEYYQHGWKLAAYHPDGEDREAYPGEPQARNI